MLSAALDGSLNQSEFRIDKNFNFEVPVSVQGIDDALFNPRSTWADGNAYDAQAQKLVSMFIENFAKFKNRVTDDVKAAAPIKAVNIPLVLFLIWNFNKLTIIICKQ